MNSDILKQVKYFIRNLSQRYVIDPAKTRLFTETLISANDPECLISEQYRSLAGVLQRSPDFKDAHILLFTSPQPRDGKTTTVANLGFMLSSYFKRKVLLIDADLRRPHLHQLFNLAETAGLSEILSEQSPIITPSNLAPGLDIITAGVLRNNAGTLLQNTDKVAKILNEYKKSYDLILIDTPPILKVLDASILAHHADKVFLLVRAQSTPENMVTQSLEQLKDQNSTAAACILVNHHSEIDLYNYVVNPHYRSYYSEYYKGYSNPAK